ncbi:MAG: GIY-YIG nuclease family protein [Actinomycetales bacterium]
MNEGDAQAKPKVDFQWDAGTFQSVIESDVDGLLDTPEKPKKVTSEDRLERSFLEIVEFYREHDRIPSSSTREIAERKLGARLDGILANPVKIEALQHLDEFGLLAEPGAPAGIDDLLDSDDLDLLGDDSGILDTSDLPARKAPDSPDGVARRVKAEDFEQFEPSFKQKHAELASGDVKLLPFPGREHIVPGAFFVLNGVLAFIAEVGEATYKTVGGKPEKKERLRCIFENGTESSLYRSSLSIRLHEQDGRIVVPADYEAVMAEDEATGYIYVLRSLSDDPQIADMQDLYKIGFSRGPVEKRIANAEKQATYLMAPVEIVASYRAYNLRVSALENLLHRVFADVKLDVSQVNAKGQTVEPSEWYTVPLEVINQAIELIIAGDIVDYEYDPASRQLKEIKGE